MADQGGLPQLLVGMKEQMAILAFSGVGGAFVRAIFLPEENWKRRIAQGLAGALSAIFLGGVLGHIINSMTGAGQMSYLAAGFIMGSGGELAVKTMQDRLMVKK
ncbi:hypothetical protein [Planktotalea sp.]|uniref:hypothetical protein n=1 Tax=Planktotalea sp. TaxID=2029877 RepID=UPI003D6B57F5